MNAFTRHDSTAIDNKAIVSVMEHVNYVQLKTMTTVHHVGSSRPSPSFLVHQGRHKFCKLSRCDNTPTAKSAKSFKTGQSSKVMAQRLSRAPPAKDYSTIATNPLIATNTWMGHESVPIASNLAMLFKIAII
jgi:hypothetical protein